MTCGKCPIEHKGIQRKSRLSKCAGSVYNRSAVKCCRSSCSDLSGGSGRSDKYGVRCGSRSKSDFKSSSVKNKKENNRIVRLAIAAADQVTQSIRECLMFDLRATRIKFLKDEEQETKKSKLTQTIHIFINGFPITIHHRFSGSISR